MRPKLRNGTLESAGMPRFADLTTDEIDALVNYIRWSARNAAKAGSRPEARTYTGIRQ
jgi:hypothetical protein